jgi:hypothetical protein
MAVFAIIVWQRHEGLRTRISYSETDLDEVPANAI